MVELSVNPRHTHPHRNAHTQAGTPTNKQIKAGALQTYKISLLGGRSRSTSVSFMDVCVCVCVTSAAFVAPAGRCVVTVRRRSAQPSVHYLFLWQRFRFHSASLTLPCFDFVRFVMVRFSLVWFGLVWLDSCQWQLEIRYILINVRTHICIHNQLSIKHAKKNL